MRLIFFKSAWTMFFLSSILSSFSIIWTSFTYIFIYNFFGQIKFDCIENFPCTCKGAFVILWMATPTNKRIVWSWNQAHNIILNILISKHLESSLVHWRFHTNLDVKGKIKVLQRHFLRICMAQCRNNKIFHEFVSLCWEKANAYHAYLIFVTDPTDISV